MSDALKLALDDTNKQIGDVEAKLLAYKKELRKLRKQKKTLAAMLEEAR